MKQPVTILVDGNSLWWRCYHIEDMHPYSAEYFFLSSLLKLRRDNPECSQIFTVWDSWCQWRRTIYPEYKSKRLSEPEAREQVLSALHNFLLNLQYIIPCYYAEGQEGDDAIAHMVFNLPGTRIIYGSDHDFFQLLRYPDVLMHRVRFNPTRTEIVNKDNLVELEGYPPHYAAYILAICGCQSDSVPGCRVPKKEVVRILNEVECRKHYCHKMTLHDIHKVGSEMLTPGWEVRWDEHFNSGAAERNMKLVQIDDCKHVDLLVMQKQDIDKASEYLKSRQLVTIERSVVEELICPF